ncbi:L-serine ammonia-lyase, iron-sulfur-dependent, subunit alpha [Clostridium sp. AM58-1XD]|uniref:L-cysteine desulfidase family protein n=1 Tax=Clostridium sp. AM58-1XD TaxID=2292307 RepID=UPI000E4EBB1B|nr:L-serine ammonia-lyase, iron-sulfur-dependent, subunit alpha [Clostridium sp. AM58-1XD]RGY97147.1 serine dehydratase subunit alpha family protein [Clostridium sp. AM58-1XD]
MEEKLYQNYLNILKSELIPALGCTEPIAIAYAAAKARELLGDIPEHLEVFCSGNIIKNVKSVVVPNSGGEKGIDIAAVLGAIGGKAENGLEVLEGITDEDRKRAKELVKAGYCTCRLQENVENLYVRAIVEAGGHSAEAVIANQHTFVAKLVKDNRVIYEKEPGEDKEYKVDKSLMTVKGILEFADIVRIEDIREILDKQISMNSALADEGLQKHYGAEVGAMLKEKGNSGIANLAKARAAAASDARMGGCSLPAVINSGSGNQGITVSVPVIEYAKAWDVGMDKLYRALVVSNLLSIHQKSYVGRLSAYCGAVSAACGAGAAIMYMHGGDYDAISKIITNTVANAGGIVCDGAKASCACKIAVSLEAAFMAYEMSLEGHVFQPGEGIVREDVENTIKSIGYIGRVGMKQTDVEILNIMLNHTDVENILADS